MNFFVTCLKYIALGSVTAEDINRLGVKWDDSWKKTTVAIDKTIELIRQDLGLNDSEYLVSTLSLVPIVAFHAKWEGKQQIPINHLRGLLRWFCLSSIWGGYTGKTPSDLEKDLDACSAAAGSGKDPGPALNENLRKRTNYPNKLNEKHLDGKEIRSGMAMMSLIVAKERGARDWVSTVSLKGPGIGVGTKIEFHHIFPRSKMKGTQGCDEISNIAFVSSETNKKYSNKLPLEYLDKIDPADLDAQCIPFKDKSLWQPENFSRFLRVRRRLLAEAMNDYLKSLVT